MRARARAERKGCRWLSPGRTRHDAVWTEEPGADCRRPVRRTKPARCLERGRSDAVRTLTHAGRELQPVTQVAADRVVRPGPPPYQLSKIDNDGASTRRS